MTAAGTATTVDRGVFPSVTGPVSVHSVFATAANLSTSAGLVSVVAGSRPAGPHTIVTNLRPLDGLALEPGQTGHITPARLRMGRLDLDLTRATDWRPAPVDGRPLGTAVADLAARLAGVRLGEGRTGATAETTPFQAAIAAELDARTVAFTDAVARRHLDDSRRAALRLLGLGQGLTPSGDEEMFDSDVRARGNNPRFQTRDDTLIHQAELRALPLQGQTGRSRAGNPTMHPPAPESNPFPTHGGRSPGQLSCPGSGHNPAVFPLGREPFCE